MDSTCSVRRSKFLDVAPIDQSRIRFKLGLEDKWFSEAGDELIHSLEIEGELSIPDLVILSVEPRSVHQPYAECGASLAPVRQLVGLRIGNGFRQKVVEIMGRTQGCTHFMTLAQDLASANNLSIFLRMRSSVPYSQRDAPKGAWMGKVLGIEPRVENACIALQTASSVIRDAKAAAKTEASQSS